MQTPLALTDLLNMTEAAVVAHVPLRDVNRVVDEKLLPDGFVTQGKGRRILAAGCPLIAFYFDSAELLTSGERLCAIREAAVRLRSPGAGAAGPSVSGDWLLRHSFLTIDLAPFVRRAEAGLGLLTRARAMVVSDPDILGGVPVVVGTRVPVHDIAASVAREISLGRIAEAYPGLDPEQIQLACVYAAANPARGRPRPVAVGSARAVLLSERRVARRITAE